MRKGESEGERNEFDESEKERKCDSKLERIIKHRPRILLSYSREREKESEGEKKLVSVRKKVRVNQSKVGNGGGRKNIFLKKLEREGERENDYEREKKEDYE